MLRRHIDLETQEGDGQQGDFLSGWQCVNPWAGSLADRIGALTATLSAGRYSYPELDAELVEQVRTFHKASDGHFSQLASFAAGSSPLLAALCATLATGGVREVFCVQPLYFSLIWHLRLHGIRARAVSGRHPFEEGFKMNLPDRRTVLLLSDPTWYAGMSVPQAAIAEISAWQQKTGSTVFIDGSFQYMRWLSGPELTAALDPSLTVRLICPTKTLALHGYRFAYVVSSRDWAVEFNRSLAMICGSNSLSLTACGRVCMEELSTGSVGSALTNLVSARHAELRASGSLSAPWQPDSGYFVFERIEPPPEVHLMDGGYFGQKRFPGYFRVNLLSPSIGSLM